MARNIVIYSTPTCGYCRQAKAFLAERGIPYREIDVSTDRAGAYDMVRKTGQYGVPVIEVDGSVIVGFDRRRLLAALEP
ncbi:MAG: glutaredoxin family protein [Chloroflexi bacterium]|nr:glutaredoxin family protein [Chloroflexota bacterium]